MKPFTIYFPQFYPTETNNQAWGHGFTDWSLVANANLRNQWIRRAPLRGFYDGSSPEIHAAQIQEMKTFGLGGFAVYHYWFYTSHELCAFESSILANPPGLPWFMIWATEGWSKRWLGDSTSILPLTDNPTDADISNHCDYLVKCFENQDYLQINGRPLFVFYNLSHFSNPDKIVTSYRNALRKLGYEIYIGHFIKNPYEIQYSHLVDVNYLFEPRLFFGTQRSARNTKAKRFHDKLKYLLGEKATVKLMLVADKFQQKGTKYDSESFINYLQSEQRESFVLNINGPAQDVLSPGWNNTPRYSERFTAIDNIDEKIFAQLLIKSNNRCNIFPPLINAWNEWSEGAAIEPCFYFKDRYLRAIAETFSDKLD